MLGIFAKESMLVFHVPITFVRFSLCVCVRVFFFYFLYCLLYMYRDPELLDYGRPSSTAWRSQLSVSPEWFNLAVILFKT